MRAMIIALVGGIVSIAGCQMDESRKATTPGEETNVQIIGTDTTSTIKSDSKNSRLEKPSPELASNTPMASTTTESTHLERVEEKPMPAKEKVYTDVRDLDSAPIFPGGDGAMADYLRDNLQYPDTTLAKGTTGTVYVQFQVSKTGKVENATIKQGAGTKLNREAIKVVQKMPKWQPGIKNGKAVRVQYVLPVVFEVRGGSFGGEIGQDTLSR